MSGSGKFEGKKDLSWTVLGKNLVFKLFFRPEEHIGPEQESFQQAYVAYLKKNLRFKPHIQTR